MENLNNYIRESLLDDEEELVGNDENLIDEFFKTVCKIKPGRWSKPSYKIHDGIVDVEGDLEYIDNSITTLTNGLFKFGKVKGDFDCSGCSNLGSLEGAPKRVAGEFDCSGTNIKDLTGAPKETYIFNCARCEKLVSLKGLEKSQIHDGIMLSRCNKLKTLEYLPQYIPNTYPYSLTCRMCNSLKNLKGCPDMVNSFMCSKSDNLESLEGAPRKIKTSFKCDGCPKLKSLKGGPEKVGGEYNYTNTPASKDAENYEIAKATGSYRIIVK